VELSESYFNEAERLDPPTLTITQPRFAYIDLRAFPRSFCGNLIMFIDIMPTTLEYPCSQGVLLHKPK